MAEDNKAADTIISSLDKSEVNWDQVLKDLIKEYDCKTGTIHFLSEDDELLVLQTQVGISEFLLPKMNSIPIGKGMAGMAAKRKEPVELCNLQTDASGVARPAAKDTKVEGSIAVPMLLDGKLYGVYGIGKPEPYGFSKTEEKELLSIGKAMSEALIRNKS